uniref:Putative juvenile hormone-inducible protein n=1 Tax=Phyllotreta striolata TaxID=444603 RepID=G9JKN9_PHYSR|nr:putative juvenile hormone-inducible protein [Phyllotreta striolata]
MSAQLRPVQAELIGKIAKENGFDEYKVETSSGSIKGDNFLGIVTTVCVKNDDKTLELILKSAHESETFRKAAPLREAYLREIYLYENVFSQFDKYQNDYNVEDPFKSYAKLYGCNKDDGNECLVMENLKTQGYQLWNKHNPMNPGHISAVLKEYAKFHATNIAMKHNDPDAYENLVSSISKNIFELADDEKTSREKFQLFLKSTFDIGYKTVDGEPELIDYLKTLENDFPALFFDELSQPEYKTTLIHGDCWCNNVLFKYEDSADKTKPSNVKIIDWQISHVTSPAYDYCYFFLVHSSKEILEDYRSYLKLYYEAFSKHLKCFNCDPEEVFSYSRFLNHIEKFMKFGVYMCLMILKVVLCDSDEAPDFSQAKDEMAMFESMNFEFKNYDVYRKRIKDLVTFMKDTKFTE